MRVRVENKKSSPVKVNANKTSASLKTPAGLSIVGALGGYVHGIITFFGAFVFFFSFRLLEFKMTSEIESKLFHHLLKSFALQRKLAQIIYDGNALKEIQTAERVEATH